MDNILPPSVGTELKLNVTADLGNDLHLSDVDFIARFSNGFGNPVTIEKKDMKKYDDDNYIAVVDTNIAGAGEYWMKLTVELPDNDCEDGFRTEVVTVPTGIIVKG